MREDREGIFLSCPSIEDVVSPRRGLRPFSNAVQNRWPAGFAKTW